VTHVSSESVLSSLPLTDEQRLMASTIADLCTEYAPEEYVRRCDLEQRYPHEVMGHLAAAGWAGLPVAEQYGGSGGSIRDLVTVHEALGRHSLAIAQAYFSLWVLGANAIANLGTDSQREDWLPRLAEGSTLVAFALTEPDSGSDAAALRLRADETDSGFRLHGQKVFITGAAVAERIITVARTASGQRRQEGLSLFLVDPADPAVTVTRLPKMGLKALDLCEVFYDGVHVERSELLGELHRGWLQLRAGLAHERVCLAAICLGATRAVLDLCTRHARERVAFGQPIGKFGAITEMLVQMRVELEAASQLVWRAACLLDAGHSADAEVAIAKLYASRAYVSSTRDGVQIFGGYGFTEEYPIARHYRDCKYMEIGGGTSEIQKLIVARTMGLG
jgi:alkylation response protein AidB-like acyl-CoA dehydrogenase